MRLSKQQGDIVFIITISILNTFIMSFGLLWSHQAINATFPGHFIHDFGIGCLIAIPTGLIITPLIRKWVDIITKE